MDDADADKWVDAVRLFEVAQRMKGTGAATITQRTKHVRRFAATFAGSPWHVTAEDVAGWLERLEVAPLTRSTMRGSVRAFYRWAHASGRMQDDPTAELSRRAIRHPVPDQWAQPLAAYERYLWAKGTLPNSVRNYMDLLRRFARDRPSLEPFAVTVDDLYEYMAGKRWMRESRRANRTVLRGFYSWAVDTDRMPANPAARLPIIKTGDVAARPATEAEYAEALRRADEPRWTLALRLAAELGMRREEVCRVHSSDVVTRDDGQWWLRVRGKGDKTRYLPLGEDLSRTLRTLEAGYAFPGRIVDHRADAGATAGHLSAHYLGKRISDLMPPGVTMHMLRHRFATRAYNVNRDVFTVQRLLGHASAATTQRYVQVSDARMRELVAAVSP